jgi:hypothetical protein
MEDVDRLLQIFSAPANVEDKDANDAFALGYEVTPVNLAAEGQPLAKAQVLSGPAAMAVHALLMKIHSKKLVSSG